MSMTTGALSSGFWLSVLGSGCCYGAIVPWWFVGAKQLASKWSLPLDSADALLLFPEGSIILVGPLMGIAIDRMAWSLPLRLALCALVLIVAVPTALLALAWAPTDRWLPTPLPPVILLGVGYACVQNLIWATITMLVPAEMTNLCAGLMGGALILLAPGAAHAISMSSLVDSPLVQSSSLIFISEIGDKTFFIATLLAARASKLLTFAGCAGALAVMTVASVAIGQIFHAVPSSFTNGLPIDDYVAIASFAFFGVKALIDAFSISSDGEGIAEEREEAEKTLTESGTDEKSGWAFGAEAATLTIAAEIGDRSQLATIALGAAQNPYVVALGATAGHWLAPGIAVLSGSFISQYFSERVIGIIGGVLFLIFALTTFIGLF